ncbi:MAG: ABC transporter permease subunit [Acidimicrobiia bacterium]|nr:ABC transporter permease subunit [Acidimicrobiia bacterium]
MTTLVESQRLEVRAESRKLRSYRYVSYVAALLVWEVAGQLTSDLLIPPVSQVIVAMWGMIIDGTLITALLVSNQSLVFGVMLALAIGIPAGILLGRSRTLDRIFGVYVDILVVTPMVSLIPIVIIVLGLNLSARVMIVFLFAVVTVVANVRTGARSVPPGLVEMARAYGTKGWNMWTKVLIPGMLPALGAALRLALSRGVVGMVIVELTLVSVGLGGLVLNARALFEADIVFAGTIVILMEGLLLIRLGRYFERRLAPAGLHGGAS